jgi:hypothetical protein
MQVEDLDESIPMTTSLSLRISDIVQKSLEHSTLIYGYDKMPIVSLEEAIEPLISFLGIEIRSYVSIAKEHYTNIPPINGLTLNESASILLYLMEWQPHDQCISFALNSMLRSKKRHKQIKSWFPYLKLLLTSLSKLPFAQRSIYRAIKCDLSKDYPLGKTFTWWSFSSCTSSIDVLEAEPILGKNGPRTLFEIESGHSGKDLSQHSFRPTECEVILLPATHLQVIAYQNPSIDLHIIRLKEIELPFSLLLHSMSSSYIRQKNNYHDNTQLVERISKCESRSLVDLSHKNLIDLDIAIVVEEAMIKKQCTQLNLSSNLITTHGIQIIANQISLSHLQILDLGFNHLRDNGVRILVQSILASNNTRATLTDLRLSHNMISDEGIKYVAQLLENNHCNLTNLWLSYNQITSKGLQLLAKAINRNHSKLEALFLTENPLGNESVNILTAILEHSRSLGSLSIDKTNLSLTNRAQLKQTARRRLHFHLTVSENVVEKMLWQIL